jgi:DNA polymerase-3 subunit beta
MKIICERNELLNAITGVGRAVSSKSPVPAMEGILFHCEENSLKLTAYDLELGIITYTPAEIYDSGDIVINARLLGEILRKSEGDTVQIETEPNLMVRINSGLTKYSFMGLPASDFPELPVPDTDSTMTIPGQDLQDLLRTFLIRFHGRKPQPQILRHILKSAQTVRQQLRVFIVLQGNPA